MDWHPIGISCPDCDVPMKVSYTAIRADGHVAVGGKCPKCGDFSFTDLTVGQIAEQCRRLDARDYDLEHCTPVGRPC